MISVRFTTKMLLVTVLPVITTAFILAYILISGRIDEFNKRFNDKGNNVTSYLSTISEYGLFSNSFEYLDTTLTHTINQQDVVAVYIEDREKSIVLNKVNDSYKDIDFEKINKNSFKVFTSNIIRTSVEINDIRGTVEGNTNTNSILGTVNIVMDLNNVAVLRMEIIRDGIFITLILTLATIFIAIIFARSVTVPINKIYNGVNSIKYGDLQHRIPVNFSGELAVLANGINDMIMSLEAAQAEEKMQNEALLKAKYEAERANRTKTLFLSSMSHEMRTPMNAILGFSQLIEVDTNDECTKENAREVILASKHLLELIEGLLDISQIETGNLKLSIESYSLKNILNFCLSMVKPCAEKISIRIDNKVDSLPDLKIDVDNKLFKQVVLNLLSNAIKYNINNGSVIIDYSVKDEKMLCLSIKDTGKGIEPEHFANLFTYFDRAGQECSNITGNGLGLAISKKLIEKMNGTIGFESVISEGSHFWVEIPLSLISAESIKVQSLI